MSCSYITHKFLQFKNSLGLYTGDFELEVFTNLPQNWKIKNHIVTKLHVHAYRHMRHMFRFQFGPGTVYIDMYMYITIRSWCGKYVVTNIDSK